MGEIDKTDGDKRREKIFQRYSENLNLLKQENILSIEPRFIATYICPLCLRHFSEADLDQSAANPLTLEDAPPKSLGGKANILTCKECNNRCGTLVDFHLVQQMIELDKRELIPGMEFDAQFEKDGQIIQGTIKIGVKREAKVLHKNKNNNPSKLTQHVENTGKGDSVQLVYRKTKVEPDKIQFALLKTAYLLTFEKYGYSFLLSPTYDAIRTQILSPEKAVYPLDFWFSAPFPPDVLGVPFITEVGLESLMATFVLKTEFKERMFSAILPLPNTSIEKVLVRLNEWLKERKTFNVSLYLTKDVNYLEDLANIRQMLTWIRSKSEISESIG